MRIIVAIVMLALPAFAQSKKYEIRQPKGTWQKPGEFQKPGEIQVPKGIQAIRAETAKCEERLSVLADALFEFDKSTLSPHAEETLLALAPMLKEKVGASPVIVEGHTDSIGTDAYNQKLSEARAKTVEAWLKEKGYLKVGSSVKALGKTKPIAPNTNPDGSDSPQGRQKNRRVEIVVKKCPAVSSSN